MSKVLLFYIMRPLLLLNLDIWVPLVVLMSYVFQIFWLQELTINVRNVVLIIIGTLEGLKGDQF